MFDRTGMPLSELRHRRTGWTRGLPVILANGATWHLPTIDFALFVTHPELQRELRKAIDINEDLSSDPDDLTSQYIEMTLLHAQLANLGIRLFQINYDLNDYSWKNLLDFGDLFQMTKMTSMISAEIRKSSRIWTPFVLTHGASLGLN